MTEDQAVFVEAMGQFLGSSGMTPMSGRMWGWLLICDPPEQSAADLALELKASRGSISGTARILTTAGLIHRSTRRGDRREYFSVPAGGFESLFETAMAAYARFTPDSTVFAGLPLFHVNALVVTLLMPLFKGQEVVWAGPLGYRDPGLYARFWQLVQHYRIASMSAVPTVYAALTQHPVDADVSSLRLPVVGASPLPSAVRDGFRAHTGVTLTAGYGLTEAICASARAFPAAPRPGSVGLRLPY